MCNMWFHAVKATRYNGSIPDFIATKGLVPSIMYVLQNTNVVRHMPSTKVTREKEIGKTIYPTRTPRLYTEKGMTWAIDNKDKHVRLLFTYIHVFAK